MVPIIANGIAKKKFKLSWIANKNDKYAEIVIAIACAILKNLIVEYKMLKLNANNK